MLTISMSACDGQRQRLMTEQYPSYPESVRWAIDKGNILRGMTEDQVYLALGSPVCKKDVPDEGRTVTVWPLYPPIGRNACVTSAFASTSEQVPSPPGTATPHRPDIPIRSAASLLLTTVQKGRPAAFSVAHLPATYRKGTYQSPCFLRPCCTAFLNSLRLTIVKGRT